MCMVCLRAIGLLMKGRRRTPKEKKNGERKANNEKMESINHPVCSFLLGLTLEVKTLMTLSGSSQHDLVTFEPCVC